MRIISVITPQKVCQPPPPPQNNKVEGSKGEDDEFSFDTDNEGICFLV